VLLTGIRLPAISSLYNKIVFSEQHGITWLLMFLVFQPEGHRRFEGLSNNKRISQINDRILAFFHWDR
jgi:hypothetical protein